MDSLTQIALGVAVADKVAGKKLGNKAFLYGAILGTIPDLDVVAGKFMDPIDSIDIHRGFSHSIVFFLLISPLIAWLLTKWERKNSLSFSTAWHMAFWCLFTHVCLDAFTSWGTQIFWPLDYRVDFKTIFVVDPMYTLPLIFCIIMAGRFKKDDIKRLQWTHRGLFISTAYLALTVVTKFYMLNKFESAMQQQNISYQNLMVKPSPMNIILWNANVQTENGYYLGDYSLLDKSPVSFRFIEKNEHLLTSIADAPKVRQLQRISEGWYTVDTTASGWLINDLRFGLLHPYSNTKENSFVFSYHLWEENGKILADELQNKDRESGKVLLQQLAERIKGR